MLIKGLKKEVVTLRRRCINQIRTSKECEKKSKTVSERCFSVRLIENWLNYINGAETGNCYNEV